MANIKLFKLTSGEEVIATVEEITDGTFTLKDPVTLVYRPKEDGTMTAGFAPFMPYAQGDIKLATLGVICFGEPLQDMLNEYNRIFGSGIVVVTANDQAFKV